MIGPIHNDTGMEAVQDTAPPSPVRPLSRITLPSTMFKITSGAAVAFLWAVGRFRGCARRLEERHASVDAAHD